MFKLATAYLVQLMLSVEYPKAVYWDHFICAFNDISDFFLTDFTVTVKLYADDAKLYYCKQCANNLHYLQLYLYFGYNWSIAWQLFSSVNKCTMLHLSRPLGIDSYTINNNNLPMCHKIHII